VIKLVKKKSIRKKTIRKTSHKTSKTKKVLGVASKRSQQSIKKGPSAKKRQKRVRAPKAKGKAAAKMHDLSDEAKVAEKLSAFHAKHHPAKKPCKACEVEKPAGRPISCPFCTKEGLILIAVAIILVAIQNPWTRYLAWVFLLAAFLVPLIKQLLIRRK
jgi:hypothetical protein